MPAYADSVPVPHCLLPDAGNGARSPSRALSLDSRPLGRRTITLYPAHPDGGQQFDQSAHDAASRHGPGAAANDERDDAADDGLHLLPPASWIEFVLRRQQPDYDWPTDGHEPDALGERNAGDDGQACSKERQVT